MHSATLNPPASDLPISLHYGQFYLLCKVQIYWSHSNSSLKSQELSVSNIQTLQNQAKQVTFGVVTFDVLSDSRTNR